MIAIKHRYTGIHQPGVLMFFCGHISKSILQILKYKIN